ncbi:MAG: OB-fold nucleic acid binding domain-containing protein [Candidatus Aenigmatarchaeota archaeon]
MEFESDALAGKPERLVAVRVRAADITKARFFPGSREVMEAGYAITPLAERVSRANLLGTIVDKFVSDDAKYASITLDDGTDAVRAKAFGEDVGMFESVKPGSAAVVIGRVKEYQSETYLAAESVRVLQPGEANEESMRKLEILDRLNDQRTVVEAVRRAATGMSDEDLREYARRVGMDAEALQVVLEHKAEDHRPRVLEVLERLDEGGGVDVMRLFEELKLPDAVVERAVDELLEDGSLFEPSPGKFKVIRG